jgi:hypothetical protein
MTRQATGLGTIAGGAVAAGLDAPFEAQAEGVLVVR